MSNRIAFIHGSPRNNGKTQAISKIAIQAAKEQNADICEIDATKLEFTIPGCSACMKCHKSDEFGCVIGDQLAQTVTKLIDYDVIVIATPTYWMSYPAQLKMLIDRMGSMMKFNSSGKIDTPLSGKKIGLLATGNGVLENNLSLLEQQLKGIALMWSCRFYSCLFPNLPRQANTPIDDWASLKKAEHFGQQLALSATG